MLSYRIALVNVFWSVEEINNRFFKNTTEQEQYFSKLTSGKFTKLVNFNIQNNIETTITYRDTSERDINELCKCNYAVVQRLNEAGEIQEWRYFFANVSQDSGTQVIVKLTLDDIQTNYFKYKNTISPCNIVRAHLNRWKDDDSSTISRQFNGEEDSPLYLSESLGNLPKRCISQQIIKWKFLEENDTYDVDEINKWLNQYVAYWIYIFLDDSHEYNRLTVNNEVVNGKISPYLIQNSNIDAFLYPTGLLCYPVYKKDPYGNSQNKNIIVKLNDKDIKYVFLDRISYSNFLTNNSSDYIYSIKASLIPPFSENEGNYFDFDENENLIINCSSSVSEYDPEVCLGNRLFIVNAGVNGATQLGLINVSSSINRSYIESEEIQLPFNFSFKIEDLKLGHPIIEENPKLLNGDNLTIRLKGWSGEYFDYDLQKLNKSTVRFHMCSTVQAEISKYYISYDLGTWGVYERVCETNLTGLLISDDTTISVASDQLKSYLANNKNFWLQTAITDVSNVIGSSITGGWLGFGSGIISGASDVINKSLTLNNLREAPDTFKKASGNIFQASAVKPLGIYLEIYQPLECVRRNVFDYNQQFGYSYNRIGYVGDFDNIRVRHNYLEAEVETISAPISNAEKTRLREKLKAIRFWNVDEINYLSKNYERSLDDEIST